MLFDFGIVWQYRAVFLKGLEVTFELLIATIFLSVILGFGLALLRLSKVSFLRYLSSAIIEITRAIPSLVWVVWIYYCLPIITGILLSGFLSVVIALGLYTSVYYAEIFRAGLQSVDRGQKEAAYAIGMTNLQVLRRITGKLAFIRIFPPFVSQCVIATKNTALASSVAVPELLYEGQSLSIALFRPVEVLTVVALCYAAIILPLTMLASTLEQAIQKKYFVQ